MRAPDARDEGTRGREGWQEARRVLAVVGLAGAADAGVAGGEDDGDAAGAELREEGARGVGVGLGYALFVFAVGGREHGGEFGVGKGEQVVELVEIGLVGVGVRLV